MRRLFRPLVPLLMSVFLIFPVAAANAASSPAGQGRGKSWAFCIGVQDYRDPGIVDLSRTADDAKGLADVLKTQGGFDHVILLTSDLDPSDPLFPSKKNIQTLFKTYESRIKGPDLVVFSFFGHGVEGPSGRSFLLPADAQLKNLSLTGLPVDTVLSFIKETGAKRSLLFLDASRKTIRKGGGETLSGVYPDRYLRKGVTAVFYAARKGQYAYDHELSAHGAFGEYLISGLRGNADTGEIGNRDGRVSLMELAGYIRDEMASLALAGARPQYPYIKILGRGMEDMVLSSVESTGIAEIPLPGAPEPRRAEAKVEEKIETPVEAEKIKEPEPAKPQKADIAIAAPAPKVEDLVEKKEPLGKKVEEKIETPIEAEKVKEPEAAKAQKADIDIAAPAPKVEDLVEKKEPLGKEAVPVIPDQPSTKPEEKAEVKPGPAPLFLRNSARDLSTDDVRSMLHRYRFYATCWNYNGDFCNTEGDFPNRMTDNQDGTISDQATGLMWMKGGSPAPLSWADARAFVAQLNGEGFAGHNDWRMPTLEELASLMENSWKNSDLFIDPLFDRTQRYCWSNDTRGMSKAWKANFHLGFFIDFPMTTNNSVRPVRTLTLP
ncbi:MAG: DUF1566 domain-containing protein [Pseudomonadota bacterium]